jgi:hypothetical protein
MPIEIIGDFSVHAEPVEAFLGFFNRIRVNFHTNRRTGDLEERGIKASRG